MKRGPMILLLVVSHLVVFALARRAGEGAAMAGAAEPAEVLGMAPAKVGEREEHGLSYRRCLEDLVKSDLSRADFVSARRELFRDWLKRDPAGAIAELFPPENWRRYWRMGRELEAEIEEGMARQPREVWEWIKTHPGGDGASQWWVKAIEAHGDTGLALDLLPDAPAFATRGLMWAACKRATPEQLATIRGLLERHEIPDRDGSMADIYADRLAELAGEDLGTALAAESDPGIREQMLGHWAADEMVEQPAAIAVGELLRLPEQHRKEAIQQLAHWSERGGYAHVAGLIDELDRHSLFDSFSSEERAEWLENKIRGMREDYISLERALRDISVIQRDPLRREVMKQLGADYQKMDGFQAKAAALPPGPDRDALVAGAMEDIEAGNEGFAGLLPLLADPALRKKFQDLLDAEMKEQEEE